MIKIFVKHNNKEIKLSFTCFSNSFKLNDEIIFVTKQSVCYGDYEEGTISKINDKGFVINDSYYKFSDIIASHKI